METTVEFTWQRMFNPILWNVFVLEEDWDQYVILRRMKMDKQTIYPSKEIYLQEIENARATRKNR